MAFVVLIPALVCTIALLLRTPAWVFRNVVLPVLLLCPMIYYWKIALLPPIDFADSVLLPIGIATAFWCLPRWRLSIMDLWMLLFLLSSGWADHVNGSTTASTFEFFDAICCVLVPYGLGKVLIEQEGARLLTVKRIVSFLFIASTVAIYEFFASQNAFELIFSRFFPDKIFFWSSQFRDGRARITGPFWQAELAGTMIVAGILLALWLAASLRGEAASGRAWLPGKKPFVLSAGLLIALLLTQSRGPELGLLFGLPIALIGRSRNVLRGGLLVLVLITLGGTGAYLGVMKYAATRTPSSEEQQSAQYRAIMLDNYLPRAQHSGPWGLGPNFPRVGGQISIDNEYLWLVLTQGWVGLGTFLLLSLGTIYSLVRAGVYNSNKLNRSFAFTMLGVFLGMLFILATVFLAYQPRIFFFLIVGWGQALTSQQQVSPLPKFQQVYT